MIESGKNASLTDLEAAASNETASATLVEAYSLLYSFMERSGVRIPGTPRRTTS